MQKLRFKKEKKKILVTATVQLTEGPLTIGVFHSVSYSPCAFPQE